MKRTIRIILITLAAVLIIGGVGFVIWGSNPQMATPEALAAMQSDSQVSITTENGWLVYSPAAGSGDTGLIFYPGARVDYRAYSPIMKSVASQGYTVVVVPMPLNFAIFGINKAGEVVAAYPQIKHWAIAGHSLGGSMAASYARSHTDTIQGIVFWASYPAAADDLSKTNLAATSIYGTLDGLATLEKINASRPLLPANTSFVQVEGGNHAQFGAYGFQAGDNAATIQAAEQWNQVSAATVNLLKSLAVR